MLNVGMRDEERRGRINRENPLNLMNRRNLKNFSTLSNAKLFFHWGNICGLPCPFLQHCMPLTKCVCTLKNGSVSSRKKYVVIYDYNDTVHTIITTEIEQIHANYKLYICE
jgi:hypothetical protein